jgi:hypothetical protein
MCPAIDNPANCEINTVVTHFLQDKIINAVVIHREFGTVYGQNLISEGTIRQWCRIFEDGRRKYSR